MSTLLFLAEDDSGRVGLHQIVSAGLGGDVLEHHLHALPGVGAVRAWSRLDGRARAVPSVEGEGSTRRRQRAGPSPASPAVAPK